MSVLVTRSCPHLGCLTLGVERGVLREVSGSLMQAQPTSPTWAPPGHTAAFITMNLLLSRPSTATSWVDDRTSARAAAHSLFAQALRGHPLHSC